ncbi:MAG: amidohydrolase family protein [Gemmatimonadetes bacterium]|nr:amidohydrolase family protein [Gemmatimonadota bacterium]
MTWLVAAALAASPLRAQDPPRSVALLHANVIDGVGEQPLRDVTIVLVGGRIAQVGAGATPPADATIIDLGGRWVLPGLIDAHTHISSLAAARRALESGVTTVRSASTPNFQDVGLRELVKAGKLAGPDVLAAGVFISPDLGESILADPRLAALAGGVNTPEELRLVVNVNADHGVDVIKTRGTERAGLPNTDPRKQSYTEAQLRAIVEEATKRGLPVLAHAHGDEGAYAAVKAGVRSIEHGTYLSDSTLRLMARTGAFLVPTYTTLIDLREPGGDYDDPVLHVRALHMIPTAQKMVRRARALGVKVITGVDTQYGTTSVSRVSHEIVSFTELGFTPLEAIKAATSLAAECLGLGSRTGRIATGYEADLVVIEGNPLEDIRQVQDVTVVVSNGRVALNRLPFGK